MTGPDEPAAAFSELTTGYDENPPIMAGRTFYGLTKREHFAALALQGLLSNPNPEFMDKTFSTLAADAVIAADSLISALNQSTNPEDSSE